MIEWFLNLDQAYKIDLIGKILPAIITSSVTALGLLITYLFGKKTFIREMNKKKANIHIDKVAEALIDALELLSHVSMDQNDCTKIDQVEYEKKFKYITKRVLCYGDNKSIKILGELKVVSNKFWHLDLEESSIDEIDDVIGEIVCYGSLLVCQLKFSSTNIIINIDDMYRGIIFKYDYEDATDAMDIIRKKANNTIDRLGLNKSFKIKKKQYKYPNMNLESILNEE